MLKDLNEMIESIRMEKSKYLKDEFIDIELTSSFRKIFKNVIEEKGNNIIFEKYSTKIINEVGLETYMPNSWFILSAFTVDYYLEIEKYRTRISAIWDSCNTKEEKDSLKKLIIDQKNKDEVDIRVKALIENNIEEEEREFIEKFIVDYRWWAGAKTIDRRDYYVSPILSILSLVNASQGYVAEITKICASNDLLLSKLKELLIGFKNQIRSDIEEIAKSSIKSNENIKVILKLVLEENLISEDIIKKLLTPIYSKDNFGIYWPLLKVRDESLTISDACKDENDNNRYWGEEIIIRGCKYLMCSQWFGKTNNNDRQKFGIWLIEEIGVERFKCILKRINGTTNNCFELANEINQYLNDSGLNYSKDSLKNFYLSLKSKPFVILAGISGTGKSKLVKLFSDAIGAEYNLISVKPDWNDSTELLGYKDLNNKFVKGKLTKIILEASKDENKDKPYFVCLDEMNLARVEYYFSEYLSLIESRKRKDDGSIVTDKIFDSEDAEYNDLLFPDNLYIVGTVNMDDTTFGFSKKVLDRANTIEFSDVDLTLDFLNNSGEANEIVGVDNSFLKTNFISLKELIHSNEIENKFIEDINNRIIEINNILKVYSRHFAYRVRDEILIYMAENKISNLFLEENSELTEEENEEISISKAFDYQIMQKILPLISGSDEYTRDILIDLFNYAFDKKERKEYIIDESNYRDKIDGIDLEKAKYKLTAKKLKDMLRGYDNGYATYWQ
ncbi:MAG: McrB family protein [Clostridium chrysemydis]|uniref:McrB family protein n=1 Tax=Clostridium chrysemydis TaxID=2665504 RepID=UPI003F2DFD2F